MVQAPPKKYATSQNRRQKRQISEPAGLFVQRRPSISLLNQGRAVSLHRGTVLDEALTPGGGFGREQPWKDGR
jgi:hypothetical protein